jgi:hypothetical protein
MEEMGVWGLRRGEERMGTWDRMMEIIRSFLFFCFSFSFLVFYL